MKHLKKLHFIIWRWWFLRFRLPKIRASWRSALLDEYASYRSLPLRADQKHMSFADWCEAVYGDGS